VRSTSVREPSSEKRRTYPGLSVVSPVNFSECAVLSVVVSHELVLDFCGVDNVACGVDCAVDCAVDCGATCNGNSDGAV